jgi:hypothetical protein
MSEMTFSPLLIVRARLTFDVPIFDRRFHCVMYYLLVLLALLSIQSTIVMVGGREMSFWRIWNDFWIRESGGRFHVGGWNASR